MLYKTIFSFILLIGTIDCLITQTLSTSKHTIISQEDISSFKASTTNKTTSNKFKSDLLFDNLLPSTYQFNLKQNDLIVQFGSDEYVWIISDNKVFVSLDSGKNYNTFSINDKITNARMKSKKINVKNMFVNASNTKFVVFTDSNTLYISKDNGQKIEGHEIPFDLNELFFTSNSSIMLATATTKTTTTTHLWLSINYGKSWNKISNDMIKFWKDNLNNDAQSINTIYFEEKPLDKNVNQLIAFDIIKFQKSIIYHDLNDFTLTNDKRLIVLDNSKVFISSNGNDTNFSQINFDELNKDKQLIDFYPIIMNKIETYVIVSSKSSNGIIKSDLYKAKDSSLSNFELSLSNINFNCNNILTRNNYADINKNPCVDMKSLNPKNRVYIANAHNSNGKIETFIKRSINSEWTAINFDVSNEGYSLDLSKSLFEMHDQPEGSFGEIYLPDLMVANVKKQIENENAVRQVGIFSSQFEGRDWQQIIDVNNLFSLNTNKETGINIILSVESTKLTNKLKYSYDNGYDWNEYYFSNENVLVEKVIINKNEFASAFYLVCSKSSNEKIIFKIEFTRMNSEQIELMKIKQTKKYETTTIIEPEVTVLGLKDNEKIESDLLNVILFILPLVVILMSIILVVMWLWLKSERNHINRYSQLLNKAKDIYTKVNKNEKKKPIFQVDNESLLKNSDSMNDFV